MKEKKHTHTHTHLHYTHTTNGVCFDLERGGRVACALLLAPLARALGELYFDLERGGGVACALEPAA